MDAVACNVDVASAPVATHHVDDDDVGNGNGDGNAVDCGWTAAACSHDNDWPPHDDSVAHRVDASYGTGDAWSGVAHSLSPRAMIHPQLRDQRT